MLLDHTEASYFNSVGHLQVYQGSQSSSQEDKKSSPFSLLRGNKKIQYNKMLKFLCLYRQWRLENWSILWNTSQYEIERQDRS